MAIEAGRRFGTFEVVSRLGVGGMGEVYRARDSRLGREVAIKVLPEALSRDAERLARFDREARALASLSHPNVGAIHGAEEADGVRFLVLELIPGDTLADLIDRGAMKVEEALRLACQIAGALEAAHERGIVHRDLKPANVKVTPEGRVKVLDFGLARMLAPTGESGEVARTMDGDHQTTQHGVLLGTPTYMSPEQARGQSVDRRSDVWAFGCLLYEMLTARKAFAGETITDVLAGILVREPDWHALPPDTPRALRRLLGRCLQRDRDRRLHDIADARIEMEEMLAGIAAGTVDTEPAAPLTRRRALALVSGGVALGALGAGGALTFLRGRSSSAGGGLRFNVAIPPQAPLQDVFEAYSVMGLSPDGRTLAFVGNPGRSSLWVRSLETTQSRLLPGTTNGLSPFFSPDGKWIGFFSNGMLRKTHVDTGEPQGICPAGRLRGASWGTDGRIVFAVFSGGLMAVDAVAGAPQALTTVDASRQEAHRWPDVLPDGQGVVFCAMTGNERNVAAVPAAGGEARILVQGGNCPLYVRGGFLMFARTGTLMAAPFDARSLRVTGTPVPVVEDVRMVLKGSGGAHYAVSASGALAYVPGYPRPPERTLMWVDRAGEATPVGGAERKPYLAPRLSPDGTRVAVVIEAETSDLWTYELERSTWTRLTFEGDNTQPIWSPDGRRLAFASNRDGAYQLYVVSAEGGAARQVTSGREWRFPSSFSPDGRHVACNQNSDQRAEVAVVDVDSTSPPVPLGTKARYEGNAVFSPDGAWIAYQADEGSGNQIMVTEARGGGRRWPVSGMAGSEPMWSRDGRELFFRSGTAFHAVDVQLRPEFRAGRPRRLFELTLEEGDSGLPNFDVSPDGKRFLGIQGPKTVPAPLEVVYVPDWAEELRRKLKG
jgi:eukaryotic-like serine/threonine-protein kinase